MDEQSLGRSVSFEFIIIDLDVAMMFLQTAEIIGKGEGRDRRIANASLIYDAVTNRIATTRLLPGEVEIVQERLLQLKARIDQVKSKEKKEDS